jgi:hypothetical protein
MIMTLLSLFGGGLMRALPEVIGLWNKKTDNAHELAMLDRQVELEKTRAAARMDEIVTQGGIDQTIALLDAQKAALTGQMQKVGIWWVDALNFLVRPLTTYYFLGLYGLVKLSTVIVALRANDPWVSIIQCWSPDDAAILSGILAFWFVGRVFDKKQ